ncbi:DUF979 domain-containing protein [uncultured Sneathia sp.]|jgi:hypothetical protein|uniref:DUF979 domain-containing protein n=1 Tax=uncultured Sneathia sp. TaxID=278067 RepID=UPI00259298FA|nr:DUF979 domain-containing protein [uncultured Sneathia sp.]
MKVILSELMYVLCGIVCILTGFRGLKNEKNKITTFLFWNILAITFIFGKYIPYEYTGILLIVLGIITVTNKLTMGQFKNVSESLRMANSEKFRNLIFIPALAIGIASFLLLQFKIPSVISIGGGSIIAIVLALIIFKPNVGDTVEDTTKLVMQVGAASLLPQLLAALGSIFTKAGVGDVISSLVSTIIPQGNIVLGVIVYVIAMAIFTMIMGNGFAAFSVITVGIGIPFVINQGANPTVVGALGMTAGFCGTLITPMAANFNIVPASILEMKDKYGVIKAQLPIALALIVAHILLILALAF